MTVEVAKVSRGTIASHISVVGNLIGQQTVDVAPKAGGRLQSVSVKLGDRVRRGQTVAKIEDREIIEQVNQAEASQQVAEASIRRSEADLSLALTNVERARNLYGRQLLPKQQLDDAEARYVSAVAQLDLSKAQAAQSESRLKELRINLGNTTVVSPTDGFVSQRLVDPGAWVSQNAPVVSVVDISSLRLVANVVEKDLKAVNPGDRAIVEVDAFPGEKFNGRIARVSPILDPARDVRQGHPRSGQPRERPSDSEDGPRRFRGPAWRLSGQRREPRGVQADQGRPRRQRQGRGSRGPQRGRGDYFDRCRRVAPQRSTDCREWRRWSEQPWKRQRPVRA
jgi:RND family efflux transporter MFP subunit